MKYFKKFNSQEEYQDYLNSDVNKKYIIGTIIENNTVTIIYKRKYIKFQDSEVRRILMNTIQTCDGIGLTLEDLQNCTSLRDVFKNSNIKYFHEFKYFTGLTANINSLFQNSTLEEITMPDITLKFNGLINYSDRSPFCNCKYLKKVNWGNCNIIGTAETFKEKTFEENNDGNLVLASNHLYYGCDNLLWYNGILPKNIVNAKSINSVFFTATESMCINKFIIPDNIEYILTNPIKKSLNKDIYMEFPKNLKAFSLSEFTRDCTNCTYHIVMKSIVPPKIKNIDNLSFLSSTAKVIFYIPDNYYHQYLNEADWRQLPTLLYSNNSPYIFSYAKLTTLPKKFYTWGTIRTEGYLMNCFTKKYNMLDILYSDSSGNLKVTDQEHQLEVSLGYKPIAICIAGTDFYGDGELARWAALRSVYSGNPTENISNENFTVDTGSNSLLQADMLYSGNPSNCFASDPSTELGVTAKYCRFNIEGTIEPGTGYPNWGETQIQSSKSMPMFTADNKLNQILLGKPNMYKLTACEGYMYTEIITNLFETYLPNWLTDTSIDNTTQNNHFPVFLAALRFYTNGTRASDWYVGASGEITMLAYHYRNNNLAGIITQLDQKYNIGAINTTYENIEKKYICSNVNSNSSTNSRFPVIDISTGGCTTAVSNTKVCCIPIMLY